MSEPSHTGEILMRMAAGIVTEMFRNCQFFAARSGWPGSHEDDIATKLDSLGAASRMVCGLTRGTDSIVAGLGLLAQ